MKESSGNHDENLRKAERISYLIAGHLNNRLTPEEQDELDDWITESDENLELFEKLTDEDNIEMAMQQYQQLEKEKAGAFKGIKTAIDVKKRHGGLKKLWPYLVAASVLFIIASIYFIPDKNQNLRNEKPIAQNLKAGDVKAGGDKAVLTLSDGRAVILDSTGSGTIAHEGDIKINKNETGEIVYNGTGGQPAYNSVSTPRGGQYKVVLSDGTGVWLNAESTLRFPAGFTTANREVELKGEGYFEVAKNTAKPFFVKVITASGDGGTIKVLGTHFNINGYYDDGSVKATLLEGSIQVEKNGERKTISPGEQAVINDKVSIVKADVTEETAWKDGKFLFRDATVKSIGEQLKRWYDVEVVYQGSIIHHFNTETSRDIPLSKLLDALEGTGQVKFELNGRTLTIKP